MFIKKYKESSFIWINRRTHQQPTSDRRGKIGSQDLLWGTRVYTNIKSAPRSGTGKYLAGRKVEIPWRMDRDQHFREESLCVTKQENGNGLSGNQGHIKQEVSIPNSNLRHYYTIIRPVAQYAAESFAMHEKGLMKKLTVKARKMLKKIYGALKENGD